MKLEELNRLQLENNGWKMYSIQQQILQFKQELDKLQADKEKIFKDFAEANELDYTKLTIDIQTGEVTVKEE